MEAKDYRLPDGSCIISEEVIAGIAVNAAQEVAGVAGMAAKPNDLRGLVGSSAAKSVRVLNTDNETVLDVYVNLKQGARIPEVAGRVQHCVKSAVQSMTGKPVTKVNVHVMGIKAVEEKDKP